MKKSNSIILVIFALLLSACTSIEVRPVNAAMRLSHVCIEENPKVWVDEFMGVLRGGLDRNGVSSEVFQGKMPERCEFRLTYTASRSWDFAPYLSHAEIRIERQGRQVAFAEYHLTAGGGLSLMKWQSTRTKMDPVIDQLFKDRPAAGAEPIQQSPKLSAAPMPVESAAIAKSPGAMAFEAEASAMKLGCAGHGGNRPAANLLEMEPDRERYQVACANGLMYVLCELGHCVGEGP